MESINFEENKSGDLGLIEILRLTQNPILVEIEEHENKECYGSNHHELGKSWLDSGISWDLSILHMYVTQYVEETGYIEGFFSNPGFFDKLATKLIV